MTCPTPNKWKGYANIRWSFSLFFQLRSTNLHKSCRTGNLHKLQHSLHEIDHRENMEGGGVQICKFVALKMRRGEELEICKSSKQNSRNPETATGCKSEVNSVTGNSSIPFFASGNYSPLRSSHFLFAAKEEEEEEEEEENPFSWELCVKSMRSTCSGSPDYFRLIIRQSII